jgi:CBS domain-containing protein
VVATVESILRAKPNTRILTIRMRETVATAVTLMKRENVSALVVKDVCRTEGNVVIGIFTERDVARALATHGAAALSISVSAFLDRPLAKCSADDSINAALRLMDEHQMRLLPVLDDHTLIGVISISDIIRHWVDASEAEAGTAEPSESVGRRASGAARY